MDNDVEEKDNYALVFEKGGKCRVEITVKTKEDADVLLTAILCGFTNALLKLGVKREDVVDYMSRAGRASAENIVGENSICDVYFRDSSEEPSYFCE